MSETQLAMLESTSLHLPSPSCGTILPTWTKYFQKHLGKGKDHSWIFSRISQFWKKKEEEEEKKKEGNRGSQPRWRKALADLILRLPALIKSQKTTLTWPGLYPLLKSYLHFCLTNLVFPNCRVSSALNGDIEERRYSFFFLLEKKINTTLKRIESNYSTFSVWPCRIPE